MATKSCSNIMVPKNMTKTPANHPTVRQNSLPSRLLWRSSSRLAGWQQPESCGQWLCPPCHSPPRSQLGRAVPDLPLPLPSSGQGHKHLGVCSRVLDLLVEQSSGWLVMITYPKAQCHARLPPPFL